VRRDETRQRCSGVVPLNDDVSLSHISFAVRISHPLASRFARDHMISFVTSHFVESHRRSRFVDHARCVVSNRAATNFLSSHRTATSYCACVCVRLRRFAFAFVLTKWDVICITQIPGHISTANTSNAKVKQKKCVTFRRPDDTRASRCETCVAAGLFLGRHANIFSRRRNERIQLSSTLAPRVQFRQ
jgi:hypothetical protein